MKCIMVTSVLLGLGFSSCGQEIPASKVPSVVLNAVNVKYPAASGIEWEKNANNYEAEFKQGSKELEVLLDASGTILMRKEEIMPANLPEAVLSAVKNSYTDYSVDEAELLEKTGTIFYQVELKGKSKKDLKLVFAANGTEEKSITYWN